MFDYILYRIGQFVALALPLKVVYAIAVILSDLNYMFAYKDRLAVKGNLKAILPEKSDREIRRIRIRVFRNFAKYLVDFFRLSKLDTAYIENNVRIENIHYFNEALAKGRGVIALTAHIGNWELAGAVVGFLGYPLWAVVLLHKHKKVNDFFNSQRENKGVKIIILGKAARHCLDALRNNGILALVGDRDFTEKGTAIDFFGKPTIFPEGPVILSLKTGAPIVPVFMLRNADDTFTLKLEKPIEFHPADGQEKENIVELIMQYKLIFEDYIRKYPDEWFMFRKFWID